MVFLEEDDYGNLVFIQIDCVPFLFLNTVYDDIIPVAQNCNCKYNFHKI